MRSIITFILIFSSIMLFAQAYEDVIVTHEGGRLVIKEMNTKSTETKGSVYYNDKWNIGKLTLFSGEVFENLPLKYDMKMNQIDIKVEDEIKALSIGAVKEIEWMKSNGIVETLVNVRLYDRNLLGFYSVLYKGNLSLLKKTDLVLIEGNYNPALDVGSADKKYSKKVKYFVEKNGRIIRIKNNKRKILKVFDEKAELVKKYANENNLSFKKDYDLAKIFDYYNSL